MSQQIKHLYEFGPYRLDAAERLLQREGESVPLTPKSFDLLLALVEHHGLLLEKDELMKLVWPDTFVEEANLSYNISVIGCERYGIVLSSVMALPVLTNPLARIGWNGVRRGLLYIAGAYLFSAFCTAGARLSSGT